jgi:hypothetical protein
VRRKAKATGDVMAVLRRREIERIARTIDVAQTDDFHTFLVAWQWHNAGNTKDTPGALIEAATRMGGTITKEDAELVVQEAATTRQRRKADPLAQYLRLTDNTRSKLGIKTIGSIDVNSKQRARRRKEQHRMDEQNRRRVRGAKPRAQSLSRTKPWEREGKSRRSWYRHRQNTRSRADERGTQEKTELASRTDARGESASRSHLR